MACIVASVGCRSPSFRVIIAPVTDHDQLWHSTRGEGMGRGDKRTRKGKIFKGSYGKSRPHKVKKKEATSAASKASGRKGA